MLPNDFKEFIRLAIANEVEYLIVGGYAVGFHGHPRFTGDLDIWFKVSDLNAAKLLKTVQEFGFGGLGFQANDFLKEGNIIQMGYPPLRIDLLSEIDGVQFDECYLRKQTVNIDTISVNFISYTDLIMNKRASGRTKDIADAEELESL